MLKYATLQSDAFFKIFLLAWGVVSQITDADLLWYKDEWKKQTFIFNGFWDIHVQMWVSVRKTLACEWLKGAFFRNISKKVFGKGS